MRRPPSLKSRQQAVEKWNAAHPNPGVKVNVTLDDGTTKAGTTTSDAHLLGGHTPVIHIDTISGAYALERVKAV